MKDLFAQLLQRSRGDDLPSPVLPSRFEQAGPARPLDDFETIDEIVSAQPARRAPIAAPEPRGIPGEPARDTRTRGVDADPGPSIDMRESGPTAGTRQPDTAAPHATTRLVVAPIAAPDLQAMIADALRRRGAASSDTIRAHDRADQERFLDERDDRMPEPPAVRVEMTPAAPTAGPLTEAEAERPPAPRPVEVRIGRIEITAAPAPAPRAAPVPRASRPSSTAMSLRDYLARRHRR